MNENNEKPYLKLCSKCVRNALKSQYSIELNTHTYAADWSWRVRFKVMKICLGIVRRLTSIDLRFHLVTIDRGSLKWEKSKENATLE